MDFDKIFTVQKQFDGRLADERGIEHHEMLEELYLALFVETGEMANETRSFKFWSNKPPSPKKVIMEEFSDCMHFLASIGNIKGFDKEIVKMKIEPGIDNHLNGLFDNDLNTLFLGFYFAITESNKDNTLNNYVILWQYLLAIGKKLNFSNDEMMEIFIIKDEINHQRQANGY